VSFKFANSDSCHRCIVVSNVTTCDRPSYSNAGDKPWQMVMFSGTQRIQNAKSERAAAIC
jgi:hypothetical protein